MIDNNVSDSTMLGPNIIRAAQRRPVTSTCPLRSREEQKKQAWWKNFDSIAAKLAKQNKDWSQLTLTGAEKKWCGRLTKNRDDGILDTDQLAALTSIRFPYGSAIKTKPKQTQINDLRQRRLVELHQLATTRHLTGDEYQERTKLTTAFQKAYNNGKLSITRATLLGLEI